MILLHKDPVMGLESRARPLHRASPAGLDGACGNGYADVEGYMIGGDFDEQV